jgi:phosphotransferase system HPr (HPr) family protein
MNGEPLQRKVVITNPQGLHMRPISAFVQLALKFQSEVSVYNSARERFDGKSPLSLLGLGAEQGTELTLEVRGPDQEDALRALVDLLGHLSEFDAETYEANGGH